MANVVRKICIDSRFTDPSSRSNCDFRVHLNDSVHIPDNTKMFITDVCIPRSWCTVEYFNENLLVSVKNTTNGVVRDYIIKLSHKNYSLTTLANEIEIVLAETVRDMF